MGVEYDPEEDDPALEPSWPHLQVWTRPLFMVTPSCVHVMHNVTVRDDLVPLK